MLYKVRLSHSFCEQKTFSTSYIQLTRNDTRVVPYNTAFLMGYVQWITHSTGAQSEGSAPQINPPSAPQLT